MGSKKSSLTVSLSIKMFQLAHLFLFFKLNFSNFDYTGEHCSVHLLY